MRRARAGTPLVILLPFLLGGGEPASPGPPPEPGACAPQRVRMEPTRHAPGAVGWLVLTSAPSPFGVSVTADGRHRQEVALEVERLRRRSGRAYVAWVATPELDRVARLGALGEDGRAAGRVEWNKFLAFVTEEEEGHEGPGEAARAAPEGAGAPPAWRGPILLTGISPSGLMHTMRGHGIFEAHGVGC